MDDCTNWEKWHCPSFRVNTNYWLHYCYLIVYCPKCTSLTKVISIWFLYWQCKVTITFFDMYKSKISEQISSYLLCLQRHWDELFDLNNSASVHNTASVMRFLFLPLILYLINYCDLVWRNTAVTVIKV